MSIYIRRREFFAALGGAAAAWPLAARAQQPATPVIGFLNSETPGGYAPMAAAFRQGLSETGFVEGRNVTIEYRWADGRIDGLPAMAADLVRRQVTVIAATTTPAALAAKAATTTIPIIFETGGDPVQLGLVTSLSRPGGNITGATQLSVEVEPKGLEALREVLPTARVVALLVNPANPVTEADAVALRPAAQRLGLELHVLNARTERDFEGVFAKVIQLGAGGLVIAGDPLFTSHSEQLGALAARHGVPAVYKGREFAAAGGLLSYGSSVMESYRLAGMYTGRILKGDKPGDLPVQQATKIELYVNLKTAKALGLTMPTALLVRADEVIE